VSASPDVVAAAVAQVEQGFAAFALRANAKVPVTEHGFKNATTKPDWIATQLKAPAAGNYGIVWPEEAPERVLAFDLDNGSDGRETPWQDRLRERIEAYGPLPSTKHTITPSGGRHVFYRWPSTVPIPPGDELFGFTVRWPGRGYLVGPGSSINGIPYTSGPEASIAELPPAWVYAAIAERPPAAPRNGADGVITIAGAYTLPDRIPGGRRYAAVRDYVASRYNAGLGADELWELVRSQVAPRFETPKTESELRGDFERAIAKITERLGPPARTVNAPRTPAEVAASSIEAADLLDLEIPELQWIVPDLIPEGTTVLAGPPKLGKSCLVYQAVCEVALGGELLGREVVQGDVLYLALEDGKRRGQTRLRKALAGRPMPRGRLEFRWSAARLGEGLEEELAAWLDDHPNARLVAIDTLQKARGRADARRNAYEVDVEDLGRLQNLFRDRPVGLLVVHHTKKDHADDFLASVSGTYGITGSADTTLVIKRLRNEAVAKILVTGRDVEEIEQPVQFDDGLWTVAPESLAQATFEQGEVYRVIESDGPIFAKAIADVIGSSREAVQRLVAKLVARGSVTRVQGGYVVASIRIVSSEEEAQEATEPETGAETSSASLARAQAHAGVPSASASSNSFGVLREEEEERGTHARDRAGAPSAPTLTVVRDAEPLPVTWCHWVVDHASRHRDTLTDSPWCEICTPREEVRDGG
jgi:DNA-binding MarR family transcriptional regulator